MSNLTYNNSFKVSKPNKADIDLHDIYVELAEIEKQNEDILSLIYELKDDPFQFFEDVNIDKLYQSFSSDQSNIEGSTDHDNRK